MADETQLSESKMADVNMTDMKVKEKAEPVQANAIECDNEADLDAVRVLCSVERGEWNADFLFLPVPSSSNLRS